MKKLVFLLLAAGFTFVLKAQQPKIDSSRYLPIVTFTQQQDHENMMQQLGIIELRPGPSGNESDPNHANYDEALANPCPQLPDMLTTKNGKKVTTPEMWWKQRRPEIVEDIEREMYGRLPGNIPDVKWTVKITDREWVGWTPPCARRSRRLQPSRYSMTT